MGHARSSYLAAICAAAFIAKPAAAQVDPIRVFRLSADQVMANLATRCTQNKGAVEQASATMVVCVIQGGIGEMLLFGTRSGATPVYRYRFIIIAGQDNVTVMPSATLDTMNAFGGARSEPRNIKQDERTRILMAATGKFEGAPFPQPPPSAQLAPNPTESPTPQGQLQPQQ